jgi:hypothetical protein
MFFGCSWIVLLIQPNTGFIVLLLASVGIYAILKDFYKQVILGDINKSEIEKT